MKYYLAIDLGASSGRHIVGHVENNEIILDEVYRFPTGMSESNQGLIWETDRLFNEIKNGIKEAFKKYPSIESLAIDTWGVDYVLLNDDKDIKPHFAYRNDRVNLRVDEVHKLIPFESLYASTGIQFASFNTIYQLYDDLKKERLRKATDFLFLPQYFVYLLTGIKKHEYTEATTSGLINVQTKQYDVNIIKNLGLPIKIFKECELPGTFVGYLKDSISQEVGGQLKVVLAPSHDTACAFEAIETEDDAAFLSSGTWSLLGYKLKKANTSDESYQANFTNEGGVGYIRYLKNIMGMWIPNQIQKVVKCSIQEMIEEAIASSYCEVFDVNDPSLTSPKDMKVAIFKLLKHNPPKTDGDLFNSIYYSLAESYNQTLKDLEYCLKIKINTLYIVGGGSKNQYLNELTEKITGKKVIAMPIEATAIGNIKTQIKANE